MDVVTLYISQNDRKQRRMKLIQNSVNKRKEMIAYCQWKRRLLMQQLFLKQEELNCVLLSNNCMESPALEFPQIELQGIQHGAFGISEISNMFNIPKTPEMLQSSDNHETAEILETSDNHEPAEILETSEKPETFENGSAFFQEKFGMERKALEILCSLLVKLGGNYKFNDDISLEKRIAIALCTLRSSEEFETIANQFGITKDCVLKILKEFCKDIWKALENDYLPANCFHHEKIFDNLKGFEELGFPQCVGVLERLHIEVKPPEADLGKYINSKGWYSTSLLALIDHRSRFLYINVGIPGRFNDGELYNRSNLRKMLKNSILERHTTCKIMTNVNIPLFILGGSNFPFNRNLMKPYPIQDSSDPKQKIYNFCFWRTQRVAKKAFIQMQTRFQRMRNLSNLDIGTVKLISKCCCVLHNFLITNGCKMYENLDFNSNEFDQSKPQPEQPVKIRKANNMDAYKIQQAVATYLLDNATMSDEASD